MTRMVQCVYLKKEAPGLDFSPYPGELGKRIYDNVSKEAFEAWKRHQTMLVNENRLNLADARARQYLARQMEQFFFGSGAEQPAGPMQEHDPERDAQQRIDTDLVEQRGDCARHDPVGGQPGDPDGGVPCGA